MKVLQWLFCLGLLLIWSSNANAQYVLHSDGYYYNGNQAYTRSIVTTPGYYSGGCYYPSSSYYQYTPYTAPAQAAPQISHKDPDWRSKLLDLAAQRDKFEGKIRADAFEHQYFAEAVKLLGLEGNFRWNGYGQAIPFAPGIVMPGSPGYSYSGNYYHNTYPINANTQYGYSYNSLAQMYGDTNLNQLYQQAAQLAQGAQRLGSDATLQFGQLVGQAGQNQAKLAEYLGKAEVVKQVLLALQNPAESKGYSFKVTPNGAIEKDGSNVNPKDKQSLLQAWGDHAAAKCGDCHTGATPKGGFSLDSYLTMTQKEKQDRVWSRLFTTDPAKMMPRVEGGGAGTPLTESEKRLWLLN